MVRVLLATIRSLGNHPCPRCEIEKSHISALGTEEDLEQRDNLRVDSESRRKRIASARKDIFVKGVGVTGKKVEDRLKDRSEVPVHVRCILPHISQPKFLTFCRMHSRRDCSHLDLIFSQCSSPTFCMSSNLESGRVLSCT